MLLLHFLTLSSLKDQSELYSDDKTFKEPDQWFNVF